jgi:hypothetical protein
MGDNITVNTQNSIRITSRVRTKMCTKKGTLHKLKVSLLDIISVIFKIVEDKEYEKAGK